VTHVMVEMWGGGAGGGAPFDLPGGGGGAYSRKVITVTPGTTYTVEVGGGGKAEVPFQSAPTNGGDSSFGDGNQILLLAGGGFAGGLGGIADSSADIGRSGLNEASGSGGPAFGAKFCPGPNGETTGKGGDLLSGGIDGYVLLTW